MSKQLGQEANCRQRFLEVLRSLLQLLREELQWIQKSSGGAFPKPRNGGLEMSIRTCTTTTTTTTPTTTTTVTTTLAKKKYIYIFFFH
jgi:hypothetical protein